MFPPGGFGKSPPGGCGNRGPGGPPGGPGGPGGPGVPGGPPGVFRGHPGDYVGPPSGYGGPAGYGGSGGYGGPAGYGPVGYGGPAGPYVGPPGGPGPYQGNAFGGQPLYPPQQALPKPPIEGPDFRYFQSGEDWKERFHLEAIVFISPFLNIIYIIDVIFLGQSPVSPGHQT